MKKWLPFIGACVIGLAIFLLAENTVAQSFQQCVTDERTHQSTNNPDKSRFIIGRVIEPQFVCSVEFLDTHNGFVAALAGIAVAIFTYTLYTASIEQAGLIRDSIKLARDEFLATHRPKIVLHSCDLTIDAVPGGADNDDGIIGATIIYFNKGRSPARVVEIRGQITRRRRLPSYLAMFPTIEVPTDEIGTGGKGYVRVKSDYRLLPEKNLQRHEKTPATDIFCLCKIIYEDRRSGGRRETGICKRLNAIGERWESVKNSEHEYAY